MSRAAADVSFCMIVRDGAATLPACLRSVAGLCDELIVVDTGSEDDSRDIARSFGARIVQARWQDDFSAARNVYLEHARCAWILSLDADEVLGHADQDAFTRALVDHPTTAFLFRIHNDFGDGEAPGPVLPSRLHRESSGGTGYMVTRTIRLFPNVRGMRYCYPVHESLFPAIKRARLRVGQCAIPIRHTVNARRDSRAKRSLYRSLGEKKIAEFPGYFLGYLELGSVYLHEDEPGAAARMFAHAIRLAPRCVEAHYWLALALRREGREAECRRFVDAARRRFPRNADIRRLVDVHPIE